VHLSPGVNLPKEISYQISVGMNYLYYQPLNKQLITEAWLDFVRRMTWRLHFKIEEGDQAPSYDPEYECSPAFETMSERLNKSKKPPALPLYLTLGLAKGRRFVHDTIVKIPSETETHTSNAFVPSPSKIREFLVTHDYIITGTDKNLGIAVSERAWIIEKSLQILNSEADYKPLSQIQVNAILSKKCIEMSKIADLASGLKGRYDENRPHHYPADNLPKFLRSNITPPGKAHAVPFFYGIPKIHKQPVKFRPIIPCHSVVFNPAAKYISTKLKPIIQSAPTIIHGTKDLAQKLSKLNIDNRRKWYLVTGDVVAFYPNIPLRKCLDIIYDMYLMFYWWNDRELHSEPAKRVQEVFKRCLEVGNTSLVTQFMDKFYLQKQGLAMGVADSPDLANLYGWHFENKADIINDPKVPFYGRYIDDCFGIIYANSELEAVEYLEQKIKFDGCVIEWQASDNSVPFLDMLVYVDENNKIQHKPYRKAQSHQERIPWISHHPLDVKRGTFVGEMSRLATLSSLREHYLEAIKGLVSLYVVRGYPEDLVITWVKNNLQERWNNRLTTRDKSSSEEVLVLKTEFNPAWNYFNATKLGDTILGYWREYMERCDRREWNRDFPRPYEESSGDQRPDASVLTRVDIGEDFWLPDIRKMGILNRRMITSRKRTRNLFDMTTTWKKVVLLKLDELEAKGTGEQLVQPRPRVQPPMVGPSHIATSDRQDSDDEETIWIHRRSSPPAPDAWTYGRN
jgi:hypothetical protein